MLRSSPRHLSLSVALLADPGARGSDPGPGQATVPLLTASPGSILTRPSGSLWPQGFAGLGQRHHSRLCLGLTRPPFHMALCPGLLCLLLERLHGSQVGRSLTDCNRRGPASRSRLLLRSQGHVSLGVLSSPLAPWSPGNMSLVDSGSWSCRGAGGWPQAARRVRVNSGVSPRGSRAGPRGPVLWHRHEWPGWEQLCRA